MCDTIVCLPSVTKSGRLIFAKNSDRSPNEPQVIERIPSKDYDLEIEPMLKATYIKIPQVEHTYAITIFRPSWMWGCEMGFNEHGVNIGNEAVFTKVKRGKDSLIGMDYVRLALERSKTAYEALFCITELLAQYGQGGNCGYQKKFYYDNSYLIADGKEAYVLETAGKYWVAKKVKDYYAISNELTIGNDFDFSHPDIELMKKNNPQFSFSKRYKEPVFSYFSKARIRRNSALTVLKEIRGNITVETLMDILRSHTVPNDKASVSSICMHAGGLIGDHTTGSYIVEYSDKENIYYVTGASLPCLSIYKPLLQKEIKGECTNQGLKYWYDRELLIRYFLSGQANRLAFINERNKLEQEILANIKNEQNLEALIPKFTKKEQELIDKYLLPLKNTPHHFTLGKASYRRYWSKKTKRLIKDINA